MDTAQAQVFAERCHKEAKYQAAWKKDWGFLSSKPDEFADLDKVEATVKTFKDPHAHLLPHVQPGSLIAEPPHRSSAAVRSRCDTMQAAVRARHEYRGNGIVFPEHKLEANIPATLHETWKADMKTMTKHPSNRQEALSRMRSKPTRDELVTTGLMPDAPIATAHLSMSETLQMKGTNPPLGTTSQQLASDADLLHTVLRKREAQPTHKYDRPLTTFQEVGWRAQNPKSLERFGTAQFGIKKTNL